ncbi:hypothetical protein Y1Q_0021214 [Alligator mississippiensis]|uniref:Uncharacterized protein n=1 Tax=Alligator mississippiensis TaxID=8496 RepID=A0A151MRX5_ALLMI|nr:hypothetical protein Y1Q_0021214 [Alligator mississippiensis]
MCHRQGTSPGFFGKRDSFVSKSIDRAGEIHQTRNLWRQCALDKRVALSIMKLATPARLHYITNQFSVDHCMASMVTYEHGSTLVHLKKSQPYWARNEDINVFYQQLEEEIEETHRNETIIIFGNFNVILRIGLVL